MSHQLSKNDPIFYQRALRGLLDEARENGVNVNLVGNILMFDDEKNGISTTSCAVILAKKDKSIK